MGRWDGVCAQYGSRAVLAGRNCSSCCFPSSWGSALLRALEQSPGVLWVLSQWVTSFLWVPLGCSPSEMCPPGLVKPLHWCRQRRFCTELQSTRGAFPAIMNLFPSSSMPKPVRAAERPDAHPGHTECALDKPLLPGSVSQPGAVQSHLQAGGLRQAG